MARAFHLIVPLSKVAKSRSREVALWGQSCKTAIGRFGVRILIAETPTGKKLLLMALHGEVIPHTASVLPSKMRWRNRNFFGKTFFEKKFCRPRTLGGLQILEDTLL